MPVLAACVAVLLGCATGRQAVNTAATDPRWAPIDSMSDAGLYASALKATEVVLDEARTANDWRTEFRAWAYRARFQEYTGAEMGTVIAALEERAASTDLVPLQQLLRSLIGEAYWRWYQMDRWRIMDRALQTQAGTDPATWDQSAFMRKVIAEMSASVEPYDTLKRLPAGELAPLLLPEDATLLRAGLQLRPTVYDILAHRALAIFRDPETRLSEPAWRFTLDDAFLFTLFEPFAHKELQHRDSTAWEFQALRLFQRLERIHLSDAEPDALVDVTLDRLHFVHTHSTHPDKDALYLSALELLRSRLPQNACEAEVMVAIAERHVAQGAHYQRLDTAATWKWERRTARDMARAALDKWPGTYGARRAQALMARLEKPAMDVQMEEAQAPHTPFRVALSYTNLRQVWVRVVAAEEPEPADHEERYKRLLKRTPLRAWRVELEDDGDLNEHLTELPVDGVPQGRYYVIVSHDERFALGSSLMRFAPLTATHLSLTTRQHDDRATVLVTDRMSGAPIPDARAELFVPRWTGRERRDERIASTTTDANGMATVSLGAEVRGAYTWTVTHGGATLRAQGYHYMHGDADVDPVRTFIFTDRAIYRPGQPVYYKGIVTVKRQGAITTLAGHPTTVRFTDVNGEEVARHEVTTDAHGSFHGTFTAPQGVLTGAMTLSDPHGSRSIRVEEYKRPRFEVVLDPVSDASRLGDTARVTGTARSYAGVPLDGAEARWRVMRDVRPPGWWYGSGGGFRRSATPWGRPVEIARGSAHTDAQGAFTVAFPAVPDRSIAHMPDIAFTYTVEVDVVDMNGETQTGRTQLTVGTHSIELHIGMEEAVDRATMGPVQMEVRNLNGERMGLPFEVRISKLRPPTGAPKRARPWERPDRPVIDPIAFADRFPHDAYADEDDPANWEDGDETFGFGQEAPDTLPVDLSMMRNWPVGTYRVEMKAADPYGGTVKAAKIITLYDATGIDNGFGHTAFHVQPVRAQVEPGDKAVLLITSALPRAHVLMEVERDGTIAVQRWFDLRNGQQRVELDVRESDRGGFTVHFLCVERGRVHRTNIPIHVPWSNKELQVEWTTFRDHLLPGAREEWRLRITGPRHTTVAAQVLAAMYDASLDQFVPHDWQLDVHPGHSPRLAWGSSTPFDVVHGQPLGWVYDMPADSVRHHPALNTFGWGGFRYYPMAASGRNSTLTLARADAAPPPLANAVMEASPQEALFEKAAVTDSASPPGPASPAAAAPAGAPRTDFRETAFFLPDLLTDRDGTVVIRFTMPEAITRWKLLGLAHTPDMSTAVFTRETVTSKPVMVVPNLPRFLRAGDRIRLAAKINATERAVSGTATLTLFDPFTNRTIDTMFGLKKASVPFSSAPGRSAEVAWEITVPAGVDMVAVRMVANGKGFGDGEEHPLPVLTDELLVTESLPLWNGGVGTRTFTLNKLKEGKSATLRTQALRLDYTPHPAWYAVQALPYLMEYPHACAEQVFARFFANTLAAHVVAERPRIQEVFAQWKQAGPDAFASALEKNTDLKSVVLEETPWVLAARNERAAKERIALLFDMAHMSSERELALKQLREMQLPTGAWPWWSGMSESRYITQHIVAGLGRLDQLGAADIRADGPVQQMVRHAVRWLDGEMERLHRERQRRLSAEEMERLDPDPLDIHYLYARSFFTRWPIDGSTRVAVEFIQRRLRATWTQRSLHEQALAALALHRMGDPSTARQIMASLKERATHDEEMGMYWKGFGAGMDWWAFPTETHALMVAAFQEVMGDRASVNALRTHLLRLKQTTHWRTTKATSAACHALLLTSGAGSADDWLSDAEPPTITVGGRTVKADKAEAGTGTFTHVFDPTKVTPAMGEVRITSHNDRPGWGALHWQYLERLDRITPHESPFQIRKQVFVQRATDAGTRLVAVGPDTPLRPGDRLTVHVELRTDRHLDHVHVKDMRGAGLEPIDALSGPRYQGGLVHYRAVRDAAMHFFFDRLPPGTHVLEYELKVALAGDFSNGITTAMCMYAPEFASHSEGLRITVTP